jgi:PST family polysaccharide transporter
MSDPIFPHDPRLGGETARGGAALVIAQFVKTAFQLISLAVLARVLEPHDFGLFSMSSAIMRFIALLGTFGLVQAAIQKTDISDKDISELFWLNMGMGIVLCLGLVLLSPSIGKFYGTPAVSNITSVLAIVIFLQGLGLQSRAMLERDFKFNRILTVEIVASGAAMLAAILAAHRGLGVWALVIQELALMGISSIGFLYLSVWKPSWSPPGRHLKPYLVYGGGLTGSNLVNYLSRNMDNVLIGRAFGGSSLAFYQKAYALILLPITQLNAPLSRVLLPALSRKRGDDQSFRRAYCTAIGCLSAISIPVIALAGVVSKEVILLLLGKDWLEANIYFLALLPAAYVGATNMGTGWVYTSIGHTGRQMKWSIFNAVIKISGIYIASQYSVLHVAITVSALFVVMRIPGIAYCFAGTQLKSKDFWVPVLRQTGVCSMAGIMTAALFQYLPQSTEFLKILISAGTKSLVFTSTLILFDFICPGTKIKKHITFISGKLFDSHAKA